MKRRRKIDPLLAPALSTLLGGAGVLHLVRPQVFTPLIPARLTGLASRRDWVLGSGVAELGCAAALAVPQTRRVGGYATAALMVAVFPGNVQMAADFHTRRRPGWQRAIAWGRLPLQAPLVWAALRVATAHAHR